MQGLRNLLDSKRATVAGIAVLSAVIMAALDFASWQDVFDAVVLLGGILMGAYGLEDVATANRSGNG